VTIGRDQAEVVASPSRQATTIPAPQPGTRASSIVDEPAPARAATPAPVVEPPSVAIMRNEAAVQPRSLPSAPSAPARMAAAASAPAGVAVAPSASRAAVVEPKRADLAAAPPERARISEQVSAPVSEQVSEQVSAQVSEQVSAPVSERSPHEAIHSGDEHSREMKKPEPLSDPAPSGDVRRSARESASSARAATSMAPATGAGVANAPVAAEFRDRPAIPAPHISLDPATEPARPQQRVESAAVTAAVAVESGEPVRPTALTPADSATASAAPARAVAPAVATIAEADSEGPVDRDPPLLETDSESPLPRVAPPPTAPTVVAPEASAPRSKERIEDARGAAPQRSAAHQVRSAPANAARLEIGPSPSRTPPADLAPPSAPVQMGGDPASSDRMTPTAAAAHGATTAVAASPSVEPSPAGDAPSPIPPELHASEVHPSASVLSGRPASLRGPVESPRSAPGVAAAPADADPLPITTAAPARPSAQPPAAVATPAVPPRREPALRFDAQEIGAIDLAPVVRAPSAASSPEPMLAAVPIASSAPEATAPSSVASVAVDREPEPSQGRAVAPGPIASGPDVVAAPASRPAEAAEHSPSQPAAVAEPSRDLQWSRAGDSVRPAPAEPATLRTAEPPRPQDAPHASASFVAEPHREPAPISPAPAPGASIREAQALFSQGVEPRATARPAVEPAPLGEAPSVNAPASLAPTPTAVSAIAARPQRATETNPVSLPGADAAADEGSVIAASPVAEVQSRPDMPVAPAMRSNVDMTGGVASVSAPRAGEAHDTVPQPAASIRSAAPPPAPVDDIAPMPATPWPEPAGPAPRAEISAASHVASPAPAIAASSPAGATIGDDRAVGVPPIRVAAPELRSSSVDMATQPTDPTPSGAEISAYASAIRSEPRAAASAPPSIAPHDAASVSAPRAVEPRDAVPEPAAPIRSAAPPPASGGDIAPIRATPRPEQAAAPPLAELSDDPHVASPAPVIASSSPAAPPLGDDRAARVPPVRVAAPDLRSNADIATRPPAGPEAPANASAARPATGFDPRSEPRADAPHEIAFGAEPPVRAPSIAAQPSFAASDPSRVVSDDMGPAPASPEPAPSGSGAFAASAEDLRRAIEPSSRDDASIGDERAIGAAPPRVAGPDMRPNARAEHSPDPAPLARPAPQRQSAAPPASGEPADIAVPDLATPETPAASLDPVTRRDEIVGRSAAPDSGRTERTDDRRFIAAKPPAVTPESSSPPDLTEAATGVTTVSTPAAAPSISAPTQPRAAPTRPRAATEPPASDAPLMAEVRSEPQRGSLAAPAVADAPAPAPAPAPTATAPRAVPESARTAHPAEPPPSSPPSASQTVDPSNAASSRDSVSELLRSLRSFAAAPSPREARIVAQKSPPSAERGVDDDVAAEPAFEISRPSAIESAPISSGAEPRRAEGLIARPEPHPASSAADASPARAAFDASVEAAAIDERQAAAEPIGRIDLSAPTTNPAPAMAALLAPQARSLIAASRTLEARPGGAAATHAAQGAAPRSGAPAKTLTIELAPESLGAVVVKMKIAHSGVDMKISVRSQEALHKLETSRAALVEAMQAVGCSIDGCTIQIASAPTPDSRTPEGGGFFASSNGAETDRGDRGVAGEGTSDGQGSGARRRDDARDDRAADGAPRRPADRRGGGVYL
jgi:chemotaxis protein MotD